MAVTRRLTAAVLTAALSLSLIQVADAQGHRWRGGRGAPTTTATPTPTPTPTPAPPADGGDIDLNAELLYLMEEEKLAHDVYVSMHNRYGTRIFSNISASEAANQRAVLPLLQRRGLADPRLGFGEFRNPELQNLYNDLIAQGNASYRGALEAGRAIELMDIADLEDALSRVPAADADVRQVMQNLLRASHNHLAAFERQLSR